MYSIRGLIYNKLFKLFPLKSHALYIYYINLQNKFVILYLGYIYICIGIVKYLYICTQVDRYLHFFQMLSELREKNSNLSNKTRKPALS